MRQNDAPDLSGDATEQQVLPGIHHLQGTSAPLQYVIISVRGNCMRQEQCQPYSCLSFNQLS